jgi:hypothetical protein
MKNLFKLTLAALLIFGMAISTATPQAVQDKERSEPFQEEESNEIKELTIRNSGFLSKSDIVIRYRDADKKIIEVIENGKKLPPSEFPRYESLIREVLEIPQIDRLVPEIERAKRRAESARISEESKIREMLELRRRLETLDSDRARRYRDINELMLMEELNSMTERISESKELSQEEKIAQLREVLEKINAQKYTKEEDRRRMLAELGATNAARRLIEEISKSTEISREEKIKELQELLQKMQVENTSREESRSRDLIEMEAANAMRKMLQEIARMRDVSDKEKAREFERILQEANKMRSERMTLMVGIEKFKFDLHQLLKDEGLLPEGKAEFILKMNECSIDGKKLPKEIHSRILSLSEQILGKKFDIDTQVILSLNENR